MDGWLIALIIIGAIILLLLLYVMGVYNKLVTLKNRVKNQWSQIEVLLKRRADLIPNVVETVKGYTAHEKETLDAVISARSKAVGAQTTEEEIKANSELSQALSRLLVVAEAYPDLKANTNFLELQRELKETEDKISYARQFYNDTAANFNIQIEVFPSNIVASMFNFKQQPLFEAENKDKEVPQVKF